MSYKVIIDAGHGGHDPGAVGLTLKEKDVNLTLSNLVTAELKKNGVDVIPTRTTDVFLTLPERVQIANGNKADLFVSLHVNSSTNKAADYVSTHVIATGGQAEKCAKTVQKELTSATGFRDGGVKTGNLYVLRKTYMPAILVESGFISNAQNENWLADNSNLVNLSKAIAKGVCNYLGVDYKEGGEVVQVKDGNKPSDWAKETWEDAISKGYTDGTRPQASITREETMAMIYKVLNKI